MNPKMLAGFSFSGTRRAMGLPCLVMMTSSRRLWTSSMTERQWVLNWPAGMVLVLTFTVLTFTDLTFAVFVFVVFIMGRSGNYDYGHTTMVIIWASLGIWRCGWR